MHILMIAPQPFFQPRGTPISERNRIRALTRLGHTVDLVTYPFGSDVAIPGLQIHRAMRPPFVSRVKIGPSWAKVPLNLMLTLTAFRLALTRRYDAVHSHEEGGGIGVVIAAMRRLPHLYDMHSSLPKQIETFGYRGVPWLAPVLGWLERIMITRSRVVIVVCEDLETTVRETHDDVPMVLIENVPVAGDEPLRDRTTDVRSSLGLAADVPVVLYAGTFESYQGLDLLYDAMRVVIAAKPNVTLVMVGGDPQQVAAAKTRIAAAGIAASTILVGQRPQDEMPWYRDAATILVSPRSSGTNTPLKIYEYLRSDRPIVATNLRTHTQVLSSDTAFLAEPTPAAFADALLTALNDPARAARVAAAARHLAETRYSDAAYVAKTKEACDLLFDQPSRQVQRGVA